MTMYDDDDSKWMGVISVLLIIMVVVAFFWMLMGCTAGRDACYICLNPSLEIEIAKQKREAGKDDGGSGAQPKVRKEGGCSAICSQ